MTVKVFNLSSEDVPSVNRGGRADEYVPFLAESWSERESNTDEGTWKGVEIPTDQSIEDAYTHAQGVETSVRSAALKVDLGAQVRFMREDNTDKQTRVIAVAFRAVPKRVYNSKTPDERAAAKAAKDAKATTKAPSKSTRKS